MSRRVARADQVGNSAYQTPPWAVGALFEHEEIQQIARRHDWKLYEPCAGYGNVVGGVLRTNPQANFLVSDIDPVPLRAVARQYPSVQHVPPRSCLAPLPEAAQRAFIVTNPPFVLAEDLVARCWPTNPIAVLERLNWIAPRAFGTPPGVFILPDRCAFYFRRSMSSKRFPGQLNTEADSIEYAWFVFDASPQSAVAGRWFRLPSTSRTLRKHDMESFYATFGKEL